MTTEYTFSDIDLNMTRKSNGDVNILTDNNAIRQSIRNIIMTNVYERPFDSVTIGSNARSVLFEMLSPQYAIILKQRIVSALKLNESRIELGDVKVIADYENNGYNCTITYAITKLSLIEKVTVFLERIR